MDLPGYDLWKCSDPEDKPLSQAQIEKLAKRFSSEIMEIVSEFEGALDYSNQLPDNIREMLDQITDLATETEISLSEI